MPTIQGLHEDIVYFNAANAVFKSITVTNLRYYVFTQVDVHTWYSFYTLCIQLHVCKNTKTAHLGKYFYHKFSETFVGINLNLNFVWTRCSNKLVTQLGASRTMSTVCLHEQSS